MDETVNYQCFSKIEIRLSSFIGESTLTLRVRNTAPKVQIREIPWVVTRD